MSGEINHVGISQLRQGMTLSDVGVIAALLTSVITASFVFGVMYGQVAENTEFRKSVQPTLNKQAEDLASIKTSLEYLVERDKEARQKEISQ